MAKNDKSPAAEKVAKAEKAAKSRKPASGKGNILGRAGGSIAKFIKDFKGETKKIVWPDRKTVIKSTGVVLAVVAVIGVIIFLIDTGLTEVIQLLSNAAKDFASETTAAVTDAVTEAATEVQTTLAAATETTTAIVSTTVGG